MLTYCLIILMGLILAALFYLDARWMEQGNRLMREHMESVEESCRLLKIKVEDMRHYRHDLARHIQTLEAMVETCDSGCGEAAGALEALLQSRRKRCFQSQIRYTEQLIGNTDCPGEISQVDYIAICGNLLDNAIEAVEKIPGQQERWIDFKVYQSESRVEIEVDNALAAGEIPTFRTTKENAEEHGMGLTIIADRVRKYDGTRDMTVDSDHHSVSVKVSLPLHP